MEGKFSLAVEHVCAYACLMDTTSVVEALEAQAREAGKSISEVCRQAGVARSTFTRWKSGSHEPNMRTIQKISDVLATNGKEPVKVVQ